MLNKDAYVVLVAFAQIFNLLSADAAALELLQVAPTVHNVLCKHLGDCHYNPATGTQVG